jgi:bifunctional ADP-heptose synthase (sugar kinase/adenylyltransferase)
MSIIFNEKTPLKYIKLIKPDIIIKGSDYKNKAISGQNFIKKYGGKVEYVDFYKNYSTTNIIKKNVKNKLSSL